MFAKLVLNICIVATLTLAPQMTAAQSAGDLATKCRNLARQKYACPRNANGLRDCSAMAFSSRQQMEADIRLCIGNGGRM